jgi:hypothetical protein
MVDRDGGIDIEVQPIPSRRGGTGSPRAGPGLGAGGADPRQMPGVDPGVDQAPHRGRRRGSTEDMLAITTDLPDTVDTVRAVSDRGHQIGEHIPRRVDPRSPIRVRQRRRDL